MRASWRVLVTTLLCFACLLATAQEVHDHPAPERLGDVSFPVSCKPDVQTQFNRAVALLHSFAYSAAEHEFQSVAGKDPGCAMAHWGIAMSQVHQLWEPQIQADGYAIGQQQIAEAHKTGGGTDRERGFINAAALLFAGPEIPYSTRAANYERAMADLAAANRNDVEVQVFYALALVGNASPSDKAHARQKQAAEILEPLFRQNPRHPGIPHYLIHAYDNAELATQGLAAAKAYAQIAPSAPHALHMPSHIFTRLGLWVDSIASNMAARKAAHDAGDIGEELHAMDYLVYAYLQLGGNDDAAQVIADLRGMAIPKTGDFKVAYAATAMPIRYSAERGDWRAAAATEVPAMNAPPHVVAIAIWARGIGLARTNHPNEAMQSVKSLEKIQQQLAQAGNAYWSTQVEILKREVEAWAAQAQGKTREAVLELRTAADEEDSVEKLPVTPGPILPAREQLGDLLLLQGELKLAHHEFQLALANSPGRAGALRGMAAASSSRSTKPNANAPLPVR